MKPVVYARVSTEESRERQTIQNQRDYARSFLSLHSLSDCPTYEDDGISGTLPMEQRPAGRRLLEDARQGQFDTVLIYRVDRLARSTLELLRCVQLLERLGVSVRSMSEPFETATSVGRFMLSMLGSIAQLERETIRERTIQGRVRGAREGRWNGGAAPLGYTVNQEGRLEIDKGTAPLVRRLFTLCLDGLTTYGIATLLNAEGLPGPKGTGSWHASTVQAILTRETYSGERHYRRRRQVYGEDGLVTGSEVAPLDYRIPSTNPALVDAETFARVQAQLHQNRAWSLRNTRHNFPLRALVHCGVCGGPYAGQSAKGGKYRYYTCRQRDRECHGRAIRADVLEAAAWADLCAVCAEPETVLEALRVQFAREDAEQAPLVEEQERLGAALAELHAGRGRIIGLLRRGTITGPEGERELAALQGEIDALESRRAQVFGRQQQASAREAQLVQAGALLRQFGGGLADVEPEGRRPVLLALVERIQVDTDPEGVVSVRIGYRISDCNQRGERNRAQSEIRFSRAAAL